MMHWPVKDENAGSNSPDQPSKDDRPADTVIVDDFDRSYSKYHHAISCVRLTRGTSDRYFSGVTQKNLLSVF